MATKTCPICGRKAASPHHIKPRSEGGTDENRNIVWLCKTCHDEIEEIYNETGLSYSTTLLKFLRASQESSIPERKDQFSRKLAVRHPTEPNVPERLARIKRKIKESNCLELYNSNSLGVKFSCGRCGCAFPCSNGIYTMCKSCRRYAAGRLGLPTTRLLGTMTDKMLDAGSYYLELLRLRDTMLCPVGVIDLKSIDFSVDSKDYIRVVGLR